MAARKPPQKPATAKKSAAKPKTRASAKKPETTAKSKTAASPGKTNGKAGKPEITTSVTAPASKQAETQAQEATPRTVANVLGEIVWLMGESDRHKELRVSDLNLRVMPAIKLRQFRVFFAKEKLIGAVLWAHLSEAVENKLVAENYALAPEEWNCGDHIWIMDLIAPFGGEKAMLEDLKETKFPDREIRLLGRKEGKPTIFTI